LCAASTFFLAGLWAQTAPTIAASAPVSFEGKPITVLISSSPGGGTAKTGRLVAQFLPTYLPGNPQTIVQNMPGGGSTIANNYFAANIKPDGLTL
jgi:tripartite-type tricarboxylate transporter receptor subunit TctC